MIRLETILVPTDFSENAQYAYGYALALADKFSARVVLVHVTQLSTYPVGPGAIPISWEAIESDVQKGVDEGFAKAQAEFPGVSVTTERRLGVPFVELIDVAREVKADLIVMATHGHTGIKHLLLGSTAERVVRKAPCPVLTVHPGARDFVMP